MNTPVEPNPAQDNFYSATINLFETQKKAQHTLIQLINTFITQGLLRQLYLDHLPLASFNQHFAADSVPEILNQAQTQSNPSTNSTDYMKIMDNLIFSKKTIELRYLTPDTQKQFKQLMHLLNKADTPEQIVKTLYNITKPMMHQHELLCFSTDFKRNIAQFFAQKHQNHFENKTFYQLDDSLISLWEQSVERHKKSLGLRPR